MSFPGPVILPARQRFSFYEYVELESTSTVKHEFLDGLVWAMAGGTPDHARIAANLSALLSTQLRDRKRAVFSSDLRVRVAATGLGTYPDVTVVCGKLELDPEDAKKHTDKIKKVPEHSPRAQDSRRYERRVHQTSAIR